MKSTVSSQLFRNDSLALLQEPCNKEQKFREPTAYLQMKVRAEGRFPSAFFYIFYIYISKVNLLPTLLFTTVWYYLKCLFKATDFFLQAWKEKIFLPQEPQKPKTKLCLQGLLRVKCTGKSSSRSIPWRWLVSDTLCSSSPWIQYRKNHHKHLILVAALVLHTWEGKKGDLAVA